MPLNLTPAVRRAMSSPRPSPTERWAQDTRLPLTSLRYLPPAAVMEPHRSSPTALAERKPDDRTAPLAGDNTPGVWAPPRSGLRCSSPCGDASRRPRAVRMGLPTAPPLPVSILSLTPPAPPPPGLPPGPRRPNSALKSPSLAESPPLLRRSDSESERPREALECGMIMPACESLSCSGTAPISRPGPSTSSPLALPSLADSGAGSFLPRASAATGKPAASAGARPPAVLALLLLCSCRRAALDLTSSCEGLSITEALERAPGVPCRAGLAELPNARAVPTPPDARNCSWAPEDCRPVRSKDCLGPC